MNKTELKEMIAELTALIQKKYMEMLKNKTFYGDVFYKCKNYNYKMYDIIENMCDEMTKNNYTFGVYLDKYTPDNGFELMITPRSIGMDSFEVSEKWYEESLYECDKCKKISSGMMNEGDNDATLCDNCYEKKKDYNDGKDRCDMYYCDIHENEPLRGNEDDGWICDTCDYEEENNN